MTISPAIEIKNLQKTYAGGKKSPPKVALKGIDLPGVPIRLRLRKGKNPYAGEE